MWLKERLTEIEQWQSSDVTETNIMHLMPSMYSSITDAWIDGTCI